MAAAATGGTLRIVFDSEPTGRMFERKYQKDKQRVQTALYLTALDTKDTILERGRQDISQAGNYGPRWVRGLKGTLAGRNTNRLKISITHNIPYYPFLNTGGLIRGTPLLWLPMPGVEGPARAYPGRLVRVKRRRGSTPLLVDPKLGRPVFFGKTSVKIAKKFHIKEIIRTLVGQMSGKYKEHMSVLNS